MLLFLCRLLLVCSAFFAGQSWALTTVLEYRFSSNAASIWSTSYATACSDLRNKLAAIHAPSAINVTVSTATTCTLQKILEGGYNGGYFYAYRETRTACPAGSALTGGVCVCTPPKIESGNQCIDPTPALCGGVANTTKTVNVTAGYMRTRGDATYPTFLPSGGLAPKGYKGYPPSSLCYLGCRGTFSKLMDSWSSAEPTATGLYRISDDVEYVFENSTCSATAADNALAGSTFTAPACTGFLGSINGKPACVATVPDMGTGTPLASKIGNPKAGALGGGGAPDNIPVIGDGSNAGGPATSKDGALLQPDDTIVDSPDTVDPPADPPTDPTSAPKTPDPCGAPGQPECGVKVNEKGTPDGADLDYPGTLDGVKSAKESGLSRMSGGGDTGGLFGSFDTFFHAPSMATCVPYVLPAGPGGVASVGSIDPCPVVDGVRTVMGYLWALGGLFLCLGMVRQTVQGG